MPRDGSGNYALPAGNPVVTGTTITAATQNTTMSDVASALTASVSRDGQAAMTGPLNMGSNAITNATTMAASGAVTAASLIPTSATVPANGLYLSAANTIGLATNSINRASLDATALTLTGNVVAAGSVTAVGATLTGTILLGGVNATDFARLSTANAFLGAATVTVGSGVSAINLPVTAAGSQIRLFGFETDAARIDAINLAGTVLQPLKILSSTLAVTAASGITLSGSLTTPNTSASEVGYKGLPQNSQSVDYTAVLADADKNLHQTGATKTFTIPSNASVAYPVGTALNFTCDNATGCSIAITTDTLRLAGSATTGTRTLSQYGMATALKILSTTWLISGAGLA